MANTYQPVARPELRYATGPRYGVQVVRDAVLFWSQALGWGTYDAGIYNRRRVRGGASWSLHAVGRAWDCGIPGPGGTADQLYLRLVAAGPAIGVCEIIYNRTRTTWENGKAVQRPYRGSDPHTTHLHIGFTIDWADNSTPRDDLLRWVAAAVFS